MKRFLLLLVLLLAPTACLEQPADPDVPTRVEAAQVPTDPPPTPTVDLPPTLDRSTPTSPPTAVITPPASPTPEPDEAAINITAPDPNAELAQNSDVTVSGLVNQNPGEVVSVALVAFTGETLLEVPAEVAGNGGWQAAFRVPVGTGGPAQLTALVRNGQGDIVAEDGIPVLLAADTSSGRYLELYRPVSGEVAVGGYYLFFDGVAQLSGGQITLNIRTNGCSETVAAQSFPMSGGGYWQGYIYVPRDVTGAGCGVAFFGTPGQETYREVQIPLDILPREGERSFAVRIHSLFEGAELFAGQTVTVYGLAYNARDEVVLVDLKRADGFLLGQATASVDEFGYWEALLTLPPDADGPAELSAIIGDAAQGDFAEQKIGVTILPALAPTAVP